MQQGDGEANQVERCGDDGEVRRDGVHHVWVRGGIDSGGSGKL